MLQLDLPEKYLGIIRQLISEHLRNAEVWAYGSRINKQSHDASDLDLVIRKTESTWSEVMEFKEALQNSNLPILVDVMDWRMIPESFKDEIKKGHVVIFLDE